MPSYLSNAELLREIHASKSSFCYFIDGDHYDVIVDSLKAVANPTDGMTVRLMTWDHIPAANPAEKKSRRTGGAEKAKVNFYPFKHFRRAAGRWVEVGRSHWRGGLKNGHFSTDHGRVTNGLAKAWMLLAERYSTRPNFARYSYRDEMVASALQQLCQAGLSFEEGRSNNPFSFYTTTVHHAFVRALNLESRQREIRDDILQDAGAPVSFHRQEQWADWTPKPPKGRPGRKPKATLDGQPPA